MSLNELSENGFQGKMRTDVIEKVHYDGPISIANLFKGNKIVIGIFSYMGISFLTSVISSFFTFFFVMTNQNNFKDGLLFPILNSGNIIIILFNLTVCIILFFAVYFLHKNKLDLE